MKNNFKLFLKTFFICTISFLIFLSLGYFYLSDNIKEIDSNTENIPYNQVPSENVGILFSWVDEEAFFYLDFFESKLIVSLNPDKTNDGMINGYSHTYTVNANDMLIVDCIDNIGGVELLYNDEKIRYTGIQLLELLKRTNSLQVRRDIIKEAVEIFENYGISSSFFSDVITNSNTNLKLSDSYFWADYLPLLCENLYFID